MIKYRPMKPLTPRLKKELKKDLIIFVISIFCAIVLVATNAVPIFFTNTNLSHWVASLIAGVFFTSVFTTAPAIAALAVIAHGNSAWQTAFFGAFGSLLGDMFIFKFVRDNVSRDFQFLFNEIRQEKRWLKIHHRWGELKAFRWLVPLIGALIIASPLPDEIGLTILGLSKIKMRVMIPLTYALNFIGILLIATAGKIWL